jgi:hypothetical protein
MLSITGSKIKERNIRENYKLHNKFFNIFFILNIKYLST